MALPHVTSVPRLGALVASGAPERPSPGRSVGLQYADEFVTYELLERMANGLRFSDGGGWNTWEPIQVLVDALTTRKVGGTVVVQHGHGSFGIEGKDGAWFAALTTYDGYWSVRFAGQDHAAVDKLMALADTLAGEIVLEDDEVSMSVWTEHPMGGGMERYSSMRVGSWAEVSGNYPASTRARLEKLAAQLPERTDGGVVMLCGHAGTGKTRAIEALAAAWSTDARLGVVVDSDRLLGSARYLTDVLVAAGSRRQVIVAEDVDDLVKVGPKSAETSKLLNVADGLVGRLAGAGTLLVLTANLPESEIADYVIRPGRCASVIEFDLFDADGANGWLAERGYEGEPLELAEDAAGFPLAMLYSTLALAQA